MTHTHAPLIDWRSRLQLFEHGTMSACRPLATGYFGKPTDNAVL